MGTAAVCVAATLLGSCDRATTAPDDAVRLESVTPTLVYGVVGRQITPIASVLVTNKAGDPVRGVTVNFTASAGGTVTNESPKTDGRGMATAGAWTLGKTAGVQTLTAAANGLAPVEFRVLAQPGPVAQIIRLSGDNQLGLAGSPLPRVLRLKVVDAFDNPIVAAAVNFVVVSGNGSILDYAESQLDGVVESGVWTLGPAPGIQQVRAEVGGVRSVFTATACTTVCATLRLLVVRAGQIQLTDIGSSAGERVTTDASGREASPAWAPDGRRIAFVRHAADWTPEVILTNVVEGGAEVRRLVGFGSPAWSPDGRLLAVQAGNCIYDCDVYVVPVDDERAVPVHLATRAAQPAWSPDGKRVAFVSLSGDDGYHALHVMNADGSGISPVTVRDEGAIDRPAWSPDGRRIAFAKCALGTCDILVVNADGSGLVQLTRGTGAIHPAWSPDGKWIAFAVRGAGAGDASLWYIDADGGGAPIQSGAGHSPAWRPISGGI